MRHRDFTNESPRAIAGARFDEVADYVRGDSDGAAIVIREIAREVLRLKREANEK